MSDIYTCEICGTEKCVPAYGNTASPVLLISDFPTHTGDISLEEMRGVPLSGRSGTILKQKLGQLGWDLGMFHIMNLWNHKPNKNADCFLDSKQKILDAALGEPEWDSQEEKMYYPNTKKAILLIGSKTVKEFTGYNVSDVCGISVESDWFSSKVIMGMFSPSIVFHGVEGEINLALKNFSERIGEFYE